MKLTRGALPLRSVRLLRQSLLELTGTKEKKEVFKLFATEALQILKTCGNVKRVHAQVLEEFVVYGAPHLAEGTRLQNHKSTIIKLIFYSILFILASTQTGE